MLTFSNFMTGRASYRRAAFAAARLAVLTRDPEAYILKFAEHRSPKLYHKLLLEATPAPPTDDDDNSTPAMPGDSANAPNKKISDAGAQFRQFTGGLKQAADETGLSGLISKIASWFGGGGAQKNFKTAMDALGKVNKIVNAVKPSVKSLTDSGDEQFKDFDDFVKALEGSIKSLQGIADAQQLTGLIDKLQKDPDSFQIDPAAAKELESMPELAPPKDDDASGGGGTTAGTETPSPDQMMQFKQAMMDRNDFSAFGANADKAKQEYESTLKAQIDPLRSDPGKHGEIDKLLVPWMQKWGHPNTVKQTAWTHRRGKVLSESFNDWQVLAGIPSRPRRRRR